MKRVRKLGDNVVGPMVRKLRYGRRLSQTELAARCQVVGWQKASRGIIAGIEGQVRNVSDKEILYLAKALKVPFPDLFPEHPERGRSSSPRQ